MKPFIELTLTPADLEFREAPWGVSATHGEVTSVDGAAIDDWTQDDVVKVIAYDIASDQAGVALLRDGRVISWESWADVTGSGFHGDAYGGDQGVFVARGYVDAIRAIPENNRELLQFVTDPREQALVEVLFDAHQSSATKAEMVALANASGEFGELVEFRIDELIRRWPHVEKTTFAEEA